MTELILPSHVDIDVAHDIKAAGMTAAGEGLTLIADQVATLSCAALQTIIAVNRHLAASDKVLTLEEPSPPFVAAFEGLGFVEEFNKMKVES